MNIDSELQRLVSEEQHAHERYLRLANFHDPEVVAAADAIWKSAIAALGDYRSRKKSVDP